MKFIVHYYNVNELQMGMYCSSPFHIMLFYWESNQWDITLDIQFKCFLICQTQQGPTSLIYNGGNRNSQISHDHYADTPSALDSIFCKPDSFIISIVRWPDSQFLSYIQYQCLQHLFRSEKLSGMLDSLVQGLLTLCEHNLGRTLSL